MFGHTEHHLNKTEVLLMSLGRKIKIKWSNYATHRKDNWQDLTDLLLRTWEQTG